MQASFRGTFEQKVDGKGRMSVPSDLRDRLADGDPRCPENPLPRVVILYGKHLKGHVQAYSMAGMDRVERMIDALPPGSTERKLRAALILGFSWEGTVEKDGRILMPKHIRDKLALEKDVVFSGRGDHFEIWSQEAWETQGLGQLLADLPDDYDPMAGLALPEGG